MGRDDDVYDKSICTGVGGAQKDATAEHCVDFTQRACTTPMEEE